MSEAVVGKVDKKLYRDWEGKNGMIKLCSFQLVNSNRYFRTGTTDLPYNEGDSIKFFVDGKGNVDLKNIKKVDEQDVQRAPAPAPATAGQPSSSGGKVKENWDARAKYWDEKERRGIEVVEPRITLSSSQRDAITLVTAALANDCLSFGSVNKGKKLDMLLDYVDQVADRFYAARMGEAVTTESIVEAASSEDNNDY